MAKKQLIVSFIHTNYIVINGGTEKCVSDLSDTLIQSGFAHLSFYPFMKRRTVAGKPIVGVNFNDKFIGVIWVENIAKTICYYLNKYDLELNCFHIHHLKRHSIADVLKAILSFDSSVFLFVHDFRIVCVSEHFIDSNGKFCGASKPTETKCNKCSYYTEGKENQLLMRTFIDTLQKRIQKVICPSEFVRSVIKNAFPEFEDKLYVRPLLVFEGERTVNSFDKIRMAYAGRKKNQKGFDKWEIILNQLRKVTNYKFYYIGIDTDKDDGVINIFASTTVQGTNAMKNAIEMNNINCAFLWPQCPETYCYVYYELLMSGVYVITNDDSGNIRDEVLKNKNGKIFKQFDECLQWLSNPEKVEREIKEYRNNAVIPYSYAPNSNIYDIISDVGSRVNITNNRSGLSLLKIYSMLYRIKYLKSKV